MPEGDDRPARPDAGDQAGDPAAFALRVDYLPHEALPLPGRLGLTRAPGRWAEGRGEDASLWLGEDLERLVRTYQAKVLVTLIQKHELDELGDLEAAARRAGLEWLHFPIVDVWIPDDMAATRALVARMLAALEQGKDVVVHCWGGLGRAGTIAACCLAARGTSPRKAIEHVRAVRPGAVQTYEQERFVSEFVGRGRGRGRRG